MALVVILALFFSNLNLLIVFVVVILSWQWNNLKKGHVDKWGIWVISLFIIFPTKTPLKKTEINNDLFQIRHLRSIHYVLSFISMMINYFEEKTAHSGEF